MNFQLPAYQPPDFDAKALRDAPDARLVPASADFVAPDDFHATSIYPEYFKINGKWRLAAQSRMDCVVILAHSGLLVREFRHIHQGDLVATGRTEDGREGILVHSNGFAGADSPSESFAFRLSRSRETAFSADYRFLRDLLRYERAYGRILWVLGPAVCFDAVSRGAFAELVEKGYVDGLLAGNALAAHDLEGAYLNTALGQDIHTQAPHPNGHYHHIDTINRARRHGSIERFIEAEGIDSGIIHACVRHHIPVVLTGSIRDDGPLPGVYGDVYAGQDAMRERLSGATTVIALATALHAIAAGNLLPMFRPLPDGSLRPVYFYTVDSSEFAANKLADRGSLTAKGFITNAQDFVVLLNGAL